MTQTLEVMARGWGRSEEDLAAEKEQAREDRARGAGKPSDSAREARRHSIRLSLARIEEQLGRIKSPPRRQALEAARAELLRSLEGD